MELGDAFTMLANDTRASSSTVEDFWNRSFQTSTGYVTRLSSEHFRSDAKLLGVRYVAWEKQHKKLRKGTLRAHGDLSQDGSLGKRLVFLWHSQDHTKQSYRGAGVLSDGKIAQILRGIATGQGWFEL